MYFWLGSVKAEHI